MLNRLIYSAVVEDDLAKARTLAEESLEIQRRFADTLGEAIALGPLAQVEWRSGNRELAVRLGERSVALAEAAGFDWWQSGELLHLGEWSLELGRPLDAERYLHDAVKLAHRAGARMHRVYGLALLARVAAETGQLGLAGVLWAGVELEEKAGPIGQWEDEREAYAAPVLTHTGGEFDRGLASGREMTLDEIVAEALG